jgi:hypothetical protein
MRRTCFSLCALILLSYSPGMFAQSYSGSAKSPATTQAHDGQHDFDFEDGTWKIHLKRLDHPLTGSNTWIEFDGTSTTQRLWDGAAHLEQFETVGATGHVEGLTYRLYRPESHQWYIYWVNRKDGILGEPTIGEFTNGVGTFVDQELYNGKMILVRFIWSEITPNSAHFEQAFSTDAGKTWEVNWITDQVRQNDESNKAH